MASPSPLCDYREATRRTGRELPKSDKFLKFMQEKRASTRYPKRNGLEKDPSESSTNQAVIVDDASVDPTECELALRKLADMPITHKDRKIFMTRLAMQKQDSYFGKSTLVSTIRQSVSPPSADEDSESAKITKFSHHKQEELQSESRQDEILSNQTRNFDTSQMPSQRNQFENCNELSIFVPQNSASQRQSISQRLAKAARYSQFKERHFLQEGFNSIDKYNEEQAGSNPIIPMARSHPSASKQEAALPENGKLHQPQEKIYKRFEKAKEKSPRPITLNKEAVGSEKPMKAKEKLSRPISKETKSSHTFTSKTYVGPTPTLKESPNKTKQNSINSSKENSSAEKSSNSESFHTSNNCQDTSQRTHDDLGRNCGSDSLQSSRSGNFSEEYKCTYSSDCLGMDEGLTLKDLSLLEETSQDNDSTFLSPDGKSLNSYSISLVRKIHLYDALDGEEVEARLGLFSMALTEETSELASEPMEKDPSIDIDPSIESKTFIEERIALENRQPETNENVAEHPTRAADWRLTPAIKMLSSVLIGADLPKKKQIQAIAPVSSLIIDMSDPGDECSLLTSHFSKIDT